ncbi:helix-turn-helix transcriptional regulator [Clostridium sp.]|uniref:helix-turn-helix domain-containing protein n=1 Tax=Clostridium sp. TaxID=1506 RepID=UPI001A367ADA|nr:helix-turn-helix transcriptional regulator [Clostridium sp.]MBK5239637.1 helix-turn-helix transcriptional regulator [Clostridium sp.]
MNPINVEVGYKIHNFRKGKGLTLSQLGLAINKSKATVSKYEKGEISIDIITLYNIADVLNIQVMQLLFIAKNNIETLYENEPTGNFKNANRYYTYIFDGRNNQLIKSVIDIVKNEDTSRLHTMLYMNVKDYSEYQNCENTYVGYTEHFDSLTRISLTNQATQVETFTINILASFLESDVKWGLGSGVSFRPFMPISVKMLLSKNPLKEDDDLIKQLRISKEDIRLIKIFNMFTVI